MFFRKRKKKFTQINTFQDSSSGWDSGAIRPQRRHNKDEMYQIAFEMMKKGSTNLRNGKNVRQFGVMVGTDLKLVTSGDFVDRETYEALLAVDAIDAPNHQMNIPGIASDQPSPPPRPAVPEVMQHVNPVHNELVGMASVRPMRRKAEDNAEEAKHKPSDGSRGAQGAAPVRETPLPMKLSPAPQTIREAALEDVPTAPVRDLPNEAALEALDEVVPPAPMPNDTELYDETWEEDDSLPMQEVPLEEVPEAIAFVAKAYDLPPMQDVTIEKWPEGIDMEEEFEPEPVPLKTESQTVIPQPVQKQDMPVAVAPTIQVIAPVDVPVTVESVQSEMMELLGEKTATVHKGKHAHKPGAKKQRGKKK